ncbi:MAG: MFS transporter [Planctomycetaceae bacterium]|nr:MFS transporter [Planctomycetaceae bacterium]
MSGMIIHNPVAGIPGGTLRAAGRAPGRPLVLRRDLRASLADGAGWGAMVGLGETYFPAFALAIGLGELMAGLVASLPLLAGGIMQTVSPLAIRRCGSHKRWVVCCATIQALTFLPLVLAACWGRLSGVALLWIVGIYWAAGLSTGPAWNTWIGTLVPRTLRAGFFASRTRASQGAIFLGFLLGGIALQWTSANGRVLSAFAGLFAVAGLSRLVSVWMLTRHSEPTPIPAKMRAIPWRQMRRHMAACSGGQLVVYLVVVQAAVQMSGPYFAPFMLEKLHFSYAAYVALISIAYLAKVITLPLWGRLSQRIGAQRLLWIGGIGIMPISAGWILSQNLTYLLLLQVVSGIMWAAYELAFFLLFFESIAEEERTSVLTAYNLLHSTAWVAGSLVGGLILFACGTSYAGYLWLFGLSSLGRLLALPLLARSQSKSQPAVELAGPPVACLPRATTLDAPVLADRPDQVTDAWAHTAS